MGTARGSTSCLLAKSETSSGDSHNQKVARAFAPPRLSGEQCHKCEGYRKLYKPSISRLLVKAATPSALTFQPPDSNTLPNHYHLIDDPFERQFVFPGFLAKPPPNIHPWLLKQRRKSMGSTSTWEYE